MASSLKTVSAAATRRSPSSSALPAAARRSSSPLIKKMKKIEGPSLQIARATPQARLAKLSKKEIAPKEAGEKLAVNKSSKVAAIEAPAVPVPAESGLTLLELWKKRDPEWFQWELDFHQELFQNSLQEEEERKRKVALAAGTSRLELWKKQDPEWFQWEVKFHQDLFENPIQEVEEEECKKKLVVPVAGTPLLELWRKNYPELYQLEVDFHWELFEKSRKEEEQMRAELEAKRKDLLGKQEEAMRVYDLLRAENVKKCNERVEFWEKAEMEFKKREEERKMKFRQKQKELNELLKKGEHAKWKKMAYEALKEKREEERKEANDVLDKSKEKEKEEQEEEKKEREICEILESLDEELRNIERKLEVVKKPSQASVPASPTRVFDFGSDSGSICSDCDDEFLD